jgi:hypothetical protein
MLYYARIQHIYIISERESIGIYDFLQNEAVHAEGRRLYHDIMSAVG